jgi:hypothetical protein
VIEAEEKMKQIQANNLAA